MDTDRNGRVEEYPRPALQRRLPPRFDQSDRLDGHRLDGHRLDRHPLDGHRCRETIAYIRQSRPDSGRFGAADRNGLVEEYPRPALQRRLPSRFDQSDPFVD